MNLAALAATLAFSPSGCGLNRALPLARLHRQQPLRMGEPGTAVDPEGIGWGERQWKKRTDTPTTDDGACFVISEDESPDLSKQWFFCSDPSDDEAIQCELVPEWMGEAPDGGHAVWLCSAPKPQ